MSDSVKQGHKSDLAAQRAQIFEGLLHEAQEPSNPAAVKVAAWMALAKLTGMIKQVDKVADLSPCSPVKVIFADEEEEPEPMTIRVITVDARRTQDEQS